MEFFKLLVIQTLKNEVLVDQVTQTKTLLRREQWKKAIVEYHTSGRSVKTWNDQNRFKNLSYYYYLRKIREQEIDNLLVSIPEETTGLVLFKNLRFNLRCQYTASVIIHLTST